MNHASLNATISASFGSARERHRMLSRCHPRADLSPSLSTPGCNRSPDHRARRRCCRRRPARPPAIHQALRSFEIGERTGVLCNELRLRAWPPTTSTARRRRDANAGWARRHIAALLVPPVQFYFHRLALLLNHARANAETAARPNQMIHLRPSLPTRDATKDGRRFVG